MSKELVVDIDELLEIMKKKRIRNYEIITNDCEDAMFVVDELEKHSHGQIDAKQSRLTIQKLANEGNKQVKLLLNRKKNNFQLRACKTNVMNDVRVFCNFSQVEN